MIGATTNKSWVFWRWPMRNSTAVTNPQRRDSVERIEEFMTCTPARDPTYVAIVFHTIHTTKELVKL